jgi:hypothetical protein
LSGLFTADGLRLPANEGASKGFLMKITTISLMAAFAISTPALAQNTQTQTTQTTTDEQMAAGKSETCLGKERAGRNSRGGDREMGQFGKEQSALAKQQAQDDVQGGFGQQTLQPFLDGCEDRPNR